MNTRIQLRAAALALSLAIAVACGSTSGVTSSGGKCSLHSDCAEPLLCGFARCRAQCSTSRDCQGSLCVRGEGGAGNVCQLPAEAACAYDSECAGKQVCSVDLRCRDACVTVRDCVSELVCVAGTCARNDELVSGKLPQRTPGGGRPCTYAADCSGELVCRRGVCALECLADKDCRIGWTCNTAGDGRCYPANPVIDGGVTPDASSDAAASNQGEAVSALEVRPSGLAIAENTLHYIRNGVGKPGLEASIMKVDTTVAAVSTADPLSTNMMQLDGYRIDALAFGPFGGINYANRRVLMVTNPSNPGVAYSYEPTAGAAPGAVTIPGGYVPYYFATSDDGPILFGDMTFINAAWIYTSNVSSTSAPVTGMAAGEVVLCGASTSLNNYTLGTRSGRVYTCTKAPSPLSNITCSLAISMPQGVISDLVVRAGRVFMLVVRPSGPEQPYEGVYYWDGVTKELATRSTYGAVLHFEADNLFGRNRLTTNSMTSAGYVYVTTATFGASPSRLLAIPIANGAGGAPIVLASGLLAARDMLWSGSYVYYTDFGDGIGPTGRVYRVPLLP